MVNDGKGSATSPDHSWSLWIVSVVMVVVSGLFVTIRIAIRASRQIMGWDDYIILLTLLALVSLSATECLAVANGYGKHQSTLTHAQAQNAFRWFYGAQITYKIAVCGYKESILFLYLRIFPTRRFRQSCFVVIGLVTISSIVFLIVTIWQCSPIAAFWNKQLLQPPVHGHCFSSEAFWFSYALINILLDVGILVLPIYEIWKLQLPLNEKLEITAVFSLGVFVCVTSIIRTTTLAASSTTKDPSWGYIPATVWSVVEANTGTICACLPMLKQPLAHLFPFLRNRASPSSFGIPGSNPRNKQSSSEDPYALNSNFIPKRGCRRGRGGSGYKDSLGGTTLDYHQWALADGTIISSPRRKGSFSTTTREEASEDLERIMPSVPGESPPVLFGGGGGGGGGGRGGIVRTTDVHVNYADGDEKIVSLPVPVPVPVSVPRARVG